MATAEVRLNPGKPFCVRGLRAVLAAASRGWRKDPVISNWKVNAMGKITEIRLYEELHCTQLEVCLL